MTTVTQNNGSQGAVVNQAAKQKPQVDTKVTEKPKADGNMKTKGEELAPGDQFTKSDGERVKPVRRELTSQPEGAFSIRSENPKAKPGDNTGKAAPCDRWKNYEIPKSLHNQLDSWRQTSEGNCASVAVIKAATDRYGGRIFRSVSPLKNKKGYQIKMRDGYELQLTYEELKKAEVSSQFKPIFGGASPSDGLMEKIEAVNFANFTYAAMAKRAANEKVGSATNFQTALLDLQNGYNPHTAAELIGLGHRKASVDVTNLGHRDSVVAWSEKHAVFVDRQADGTYDEDNWGKRQDYDKEFNGPALAAFSFGTNGVVNGIVDGIKRGVRLGSLIPPVPRFP